ncbi:hypothetical protein BU17DRAFT_66788 [Hysterangium stoloniferum]|nr:hypothetical protein BU17DRAFT_66788 [Hysterangium stoloniferum]
MQPFLTVCAQVIWLVWLHRCKREHGKNMAFPSSEGGNEKQDQEISGSNLGAEPFGTSSSSCLNGQISGVSEYLVASGGYSDVWTGLWGRKKVAIKVARGFSSDGLRIERSELLKRIGNEYLIWSNLRHENVLEMFCRTTEIVRKSKTFQDILVA